MVTMPKSSMRNSTCLISGRSQGPTPSGWSVSARITSLLATTSALNPCDCASAARAFPNTALKRTTTGAKIRSSTSDVHSLQPLILDRRRALIRSSRPLGSVQRLSRVCLLNFSLFWLGFFPFLAGFEELSHGQEPASVSSAQTLPASVDLRAAFDKWGLARRTQGKRGTCSVFTVVGALEFAAANEQHHGERFSVEFLNWGANKILGEYEDGGFFSDLWKAFEVYGVCSEQKLPYRAEFDRALSPGPEVLD